MTGHVWVTRKRLPSGVVICKLCGLTRGPAAKARKCEPLPPQKEEEAI